MSYYNKDNYDYDYNIYDYDYDYEDYEDGGSNGMALWQFWL